MKPTLLIAGGFFSFYSLSAAPATAAPALQRINRDNLCVTNGVVSARPDGRLEIDTPSSRGVVRVATAQTAEIHFRYLGPSESSKPLASGELRRQIGLKLRAQDTCNLVYAMWHIEPDSRIAVSVKRNAGKHTHEECDARGYVNVKARTSVAMPRILSGESHTLLAELRGTDLTVVADQRVAWVGTLGRDIFDFDGPVGFRTDNARFVFEYSAAGPEPDTPLNTRSQRVSPCRASPGD
jgi:hypothetical protein